MPNLSQLLAWAASKKLDTENIDILLKNPEVIEMIMEEINELQKDLASYEQIKKITLLPNHFSITHGEVTNTMKVRRPVVAKRYAKEIEAMYDGPKEGETPLIPEDIETKVE